MSASPLPGVYFAAASPPVPEVLPRMDIAAFVGFARSGPFDVPVAIEDVARFHEIFGHDQVLAWDAERGEMATAQLAPAVRAFFRNGGRRCWVVRVADNQSARINEFMIPGLLQIGSDESLDGGSAQARSAGSWSDDLMVNATLAFTPLIASSIDIGHPVIPAGVSGYTVTLQPGVASPVVAGDVLQLAFESSQPSSPVLPGAIAYLPLQTVTTQTFSPKGNLRPVQQTILRGERAVWFRPVTPADFAVLQSSPPAADSLGIVSLFQPQAAYWLTRPENALLTPVLDWGFSTVFQEFVLGTERSATDGIQAGSWLRLEFDSLSMPDDATALLLLVDSVHGVAMETTSVPSGSPDGHPEIALIVGARAWWVLREEIAVSRYTSQPKVSALDLELWVRDATGEISRLSNLGLAPLHPLYLGYLPTDTDLFTPSDRAGTPAGSELRDRVGYPRFPLAAFGDDTLLYLPLGVPGFPRDDFYQPAVPVAGSALERDGLAPATFTSCSFFGADFFLDPDLENSKVSTLLTEAFHKQYQLRRPDEDGPPGEPLVKMHALLPIEEVSLLAVPDAIHRGWFPASRPQAELLAPQLLSISAPDDEGQVTVLWSHVEGATSYTLQQSADPQFDLIASTWQEAGEQSEPLPQSNACPTIAYFRVRANGASGISPWSNTRADEFPAQTFGTCDPGTLDAPVMDQPAHNRGRITLSWSPSANAGDAFRLEVAEDAAFEFPELLYQGQSTGFELWRSPTRSAYFRVSTVRGNEQSPFSNTAVVPSDNSEPQWQMVRSDVPAGGPCEDELLAVHQAMLRMSAARADLFAVLGLPRDYHTDDALNYKERLVSALAPEETDNTLSFGALYHPWLDVRDGADDSPDAVRSLAPDGTVCGSVADRTINAGAWIAPANHELLGVVDLDPQPEEGASERFFNEQMNLVRQESRGFMCFSSFTLSTGTELQEINVRRLLILLRRLALRDGMAFVFQSNNTALRYTVRRRFEDILANLFLLGAFAGDTQDEGFRVVTDSSVNPPEMVDQGRFVVELRVAPSLPLEFLTVRLVQTGGEVLLTEGI